MSSTVPGHARLRGLLLATVLCLPSAAWADIYLTPNTSDPGSVTFNGTVFVNQGMVGAGRLSSSLLDFNGETLGSFSGMAAIKETWRRNGNSYSGSIFTLPDRGYNSGSVFSDYAARLHRYDVTFTPYTGTANLPSSPSSQSQLVLTPAGGFLFSDFTGQATTGNNPGTGTKVEAIERGEIKALWVMATNPAVSLPRAGAMREALKKLELFVVSENVLSNDTVASGAHVLLPAAAWGERDGTATNSERRISRQRPFLAPQVGAKPDWWIVSQVARRLGFAEAFSYCSPAEIFREHAALSGFENDGDRAFDISALAAISDAEYESLSPVQWPLRKNRKSGGRFFAEGGFFTANRKARFVAPDHPALKSAASCEFPYRLNTGRIRDQWHTMTRTGLSPRLALHLPEPFVEIHPEDAAAVRVSDGGFARVTTAFGSCVLKVAISEGQRKGSLFAPIHWSGETAPHARVGDLVAPDTDAISGQPEAKATPAAIAPVAFASRGFVLSRRPFAFPDGTWWARTAVAGGWGYLFAANGDAAAWCDRLRREYPQDSNFMEYADAPMGVYRAAAFAGERLEFCVFTGPAELTPQWDSVRLLFAADALDASQRRYLLSGRSADGVADTGPVVCACFGVGLASIHAAIRSQAASNVEEIGKALRAGTNCGSCVPELRKILAAQYPSAQPSLRGSDPAVSVPLSQSIQIA